MADRPGTGSISTSPEDVAGRRRAASGSPRRRGSGGGGDGGGRPLGTTAILVVLIAGLALAGWFIAEQYQQLQAESAALAEAQSRISALEDRLRTTDQALTQTGETTSEQIDRWESEIRKLWDVSNKRNRQWIEDNQKAIGELRKSLASIEANTRDIKGTLGRHESAFKRQQQVVDELTSVQMQIEQVVRSQRDLVDRVNSTQQTVAQLRAGIANRVEENTEAVKSMDAYRLQLNERLAQIERRLANLSGAASL